MYKHKPVNIQLRLTNRDQVSVQKYLTEITLDARTKPLTTQQEQDLFKQYAQNPSKKLKDKIALANLRFVITVSKQYEKRNPKASLEDLIQHGNIGMIKSIDKYDLSVGTKFCTYAGWYIVQEIQNYLENILADIVQPANRGRIARACRKANEILFTQGIYDPTIDQTVEEYTKLRIEDRKLPDMNAQRLATINISHMPFLSASIEFKGKSMGESNFQLEDTFKATVDSNSDYELMKVDNLRNIRKILSILPEREKEVVEWTYGLNNKEEKTPEQIADIMGYTRERIGQILQLALTQLRSQKKTITNYLCDDSNSTNLSPFAITSHMNSN